MAKDAAVYMASRMIWIMAPQAKQRCRDRCLGHCGFSSGLVISWSSWLWPVNSGACSSTIPKAMFRDIDGIVDCELRMLTRTCQEVKFRLQRLSQSVFTSVGQADYPKPQATSLERGQKPNISFTISDCQVQCRPHDQVAFSRLLTLSSPSPPMPCTHACMCIAWRPSNDNQSCSSGKQFQFARTGLPGPQIVSTVSGWIKKKFTSTYCLFLCIFIIK